MGSEKWSAAAIMSGVGPLPPGATVGAPVAPPPPGATVGKTPEALDFDTIKSYWLRAGGNPDDADLMAHVAMAESSGVPARVGPVTNEGGKNYTHTGLWQISSNHGHGNWTDPLENAKMAVQLYNGRRAHGGTGYEDWEASRDVWGKYLPVPPPPPGSTTQHDIQHAAETQPSHKLPLPTGTHIEGKNRPRNEDPRLGNYNIVEQAAGHQELPFMLANAILWDNLDKTGGTHVKEVMDLWKPVTVGGKGSPAAASAMYGTNSPRVLEMYARSGNPVLQAYAAALKAGGSKLSGAATFVEEWFNPMGWAEGGMVGKLGGKVLLPQLFKIPGVQQTVSNLLHSMSIYKGIVAAHGEGPRNVLAATGQMLARAASQGHDHMMDVFNGFSAPEQEEIIRRQQHLPSNTDVGNAERNALIDAAAEKKRNLTRERTRELMEAGLLKKSQVKATAGPPTTLRIKGVDVHFDGDPGTYHGLRGQYNHPNAAFNQMLEELEHQGRTPQAGISSTRLSTKHSVKANLDEAKADREGVGPSLLKGDIDHADIFRRYMSTSGKLLAFKHGMDELMRLHPDLIRVPTRTAERRQLIESGKFIPIDHPSSGIAVFRDKGSPFRQNTLISPAFRDFLNNKNSLSQILGKSVFDAGGPLSREAKWVNAFNGAYRAAIVANPGYHDIWNVAPNASAAAGKSGIAGLGLAVLNETRALLGVGATMSHAFGGVPLVGGLARGVTSTLDAAREGLEHPFLVGTDHYQAAMHAALAAGESAQAAGKAGRAAATEFALGHGAGAEFGAPHTAWGGTPGRIYTRPLKDPTTGKFTPVSAQEYVDRMLTRADQWNQKGTFDERGEQGFAVTLFHQLYSQGPLKGDPYAVAWAVREALGNYRNLDPDNPLTKLILFAPWLFSDVPFWFRAFTKTPQFVTAPTQGSRTQRENAGDPTAYDASHPHMGISIYEGGEEARTLPASFKDAEHIAQAAYDMIPRHLGGPADPESATRLMTSEIASRMKPISPGFNLPIPGILNTVLTTMDARAHPAGTYAGYEVMYDKNQPDERNSQLAWSFATDMAPLPAPFVMRDIIRNGYDPARMSDYIQEALGMGYISTRMADNFKRMQNANEQWLEKHMALSRKIQAGAHPRNEAQYRAFLDKVSGVYKANAARIQAAIQSSKQRSGAVAPPPPGSTVDSIPPPPSGATVVPVGH